MAKMIEKTVNNVQFAVKKLVVHEIYELLEKGQDKQDKPGDTSTILDSMIFQSASIQDVLLFTDLSRHTLMSMLPQDVEQVIVMIQEENPHFFSLCRQLKDLVGRLTVAGSITENSSSQPCLP